MAQTSKRKNARRDAKAAAKPPRPSKKRPAAKPPTTKKPGDPQTEQAAPDEVLLVRQALTRAATENQRLRSITTVLQASVAAALTPPPPLTLPPMPRLSKRARGSEEIALMHLSDTQLGKTTATYNSQIGCERILDFFRKCVHLTEIRRAGATIREVHLALGGDIIEGETIFPHQPHLIDQCVYDQACHTAPGVIAQGILLLLAHFERVKVVCVPGNHGRSGIKGGGQHPRSNWDNVVYASLSHMLLGPPSAPRRDPDLRKRLEIVIAADFYAVDRIFDWGCLIVHGDQISGGFGGFPFYGTAKKVAGWADSVKEPWDYLYFGHFHTYTGGTINHRQWYCNGTTESDNTFAQEALAATGFPTQRLQFFSRDHGVIADMPVYLADKRVPQRLRVK